MSTKFNLLSVNTSNLSLQEIRVLRFFVGVVTSVIIAFAIDWPFAFITPVFVAKFLGTEKPALPFKALASVFLIIFFALILGGIATRLLLPYPIVFLLLMTLLIFWISYWNNSGGNELVITMLLVGFTVVPMLGLLHQAVAELFTVGFLFSCFVSLIVTMIFHVLIPDNLSKETVTSPVTPPLPEKEIRVRYALLSTLMIMPVMAFFFYFNLSSSVLILVFIAIMAQKPDLIAGVKGGKALLVGNTIGGIVAIAMYSVLVMIPTFPFLILLFALVIISFGRLIFSTRPMAPLYAMALGTIIILISSATMGDADASEKFYTRIFQIACACFYVIFATIVANPLIKKISRS